MQDVFLSVYVSIKSCKPMILFYSEAPALIRLSKVFIYFLKEGINTFPREIISKKKFHFIFLNCLKNKIYNF